MLVAATSAGVYRVASGAVEQVLAGSTVRHLDAVGRVVFAATDDGLYRTADGGRTWETLGLPEIDVFSVLATETKRYAGVRPAGVLVSDAGGEWDRLESFDEHAAGADWPTSPHYDHACVRTLGVVPGRADAHTDIIAGVEVGGLVVGEGGQSWKTVTAVPDDVHHVLPITADRWVVSCGTGGPEGEGGVFETRDGGDTWRRRETGSYHYTRESCHRRRLYTAANATPPLWDPADAALFVERDGRLDAVSYPGEPQSFVLSWATGEGVFAGTNDGRILRETDDGWRQITTIPVDEEDQAAFGVRSLVTVGGADATTR